MARKKGGQRAANLADHAGPDADTETIERLAEIARKANAKGGSNSEPSDDVLRRNKAAIELGLREINTAQKLVQKARADFGATRSTAKTDTGSKGWVDSMVKAMKLKIQAEKGGTGEIVTEHRQIGRILRLDDDCKLGTQFSLFAVPGDEGDAKVVAMDAELQGQHAYSNNEPLTNNPFPPGTDNYFDWSQGWKNAQNAKAAGMVPNGGGEPATA